MPVMSRHAILVALGLALAGCSGLPTAGPRSSEVVAQARNAEARRLGIVLVDVTQGVITQLRDRRPPSLHESFGEGTPFVPLIGPGDILSVTIWEAGSGTLFSAPAVPGQPLPPSRGAALPNQAVQPDGMITIPYAGRVAVSGLQPAAVEQAIMARLAGKAADPQVLVSVVGSTANSVTVGGGAAGSARVPLSARGERVLDAIASAGGLRISMDDAVIMVTRGGRTASIPYGELLRSPSENVYLRGGDILTVVARPASFLAFGAVQRNGQIPFEADSISLSEAMAKSAGLSDSRADPEGVFLFRYEAPELMRRIAPFAVRGDAAAPVPVIYRLNFRNPSHFFLASQFAMQDKDMLYVASAQLNDWQKFFNVIGSVLSPAGTVVGVGGAAASLSR